MPVLKRLKQIASFTPLARSPLGWVQMLLVGYARGHPFGENDWLSRTLRHRFNPLLVRPRGTQGITVALDLCDSGHLISFEEVIRDQCYDLGRVPFVPEYVIDCGAHSGLFTALAGKQFPEAKRVAFEPNTYNADSVRRQAELNALEVEVVEAAVSMREGVGRFGGSIYTNAGRLHDDPMAEGFQVRTVDFPAYLRTRAMSSLLLKMDIEGQEVEVMPAIAPILPAECAIFFETHTGDEGWRAVTGPLVAAGFEVTATRTRLPWMDGFALRRAARGEEG